MRSEFELVGKDDVRLHFGKHRGKTLKEIAVSFKGMMYMRWLYRRTYPSNREGERENSRRSLQMAGCKCGRVTGGNVLYHIKLFLNEVKHVKKSNL